MHPFVKSFEPLGKDVSPHVMRSGFDEVQPWMKERLVQPMHVDPVGTPHVPHRGVLPSAAHLDHCSIVLVEHAQSLPLQYRVPQRKGWNPDDPEGHVRSDNLSLRGTVTDCRLLTRHSLKWEKGVLPAHAQKRTGGATTSPLAARKVGICVQMNTNCTRGFADPPNFSHMKGAVHIAHKPVKHTIAMSVPTRN